MNRHHMPLTAARRRHAVLIHRIYQAPDRPALSQFIDPRRNFTRVCSRRGAVLTG